MPCNCKRAVQPTRVNKKNDKENEKKEENNNEKIYKFYGL